MKTPRSDFLSPGGIRKEAWRVENLEQASTRPCTDFQEAQGRYWAKATQGTSSTFTCGWTCQSLASFYSTQDLLWKFRQRGPSPTSINPFPRLPVWISTSTSTFHTHTMFVQIKLSYSLMVLRLWSQTSTGLSISRSRFEILDPFITFGPFFLNDSINSWRVPTQTTGLQVGRWKSQWCENSSEGYGWMHMYTCHHSLKTDWNWFLRLVRSLINQMFRLKG